jgi:hypothetical protein
MEMAERTLSLRRIGVMLAQFLITHDRSSSSGPHPAAQVVR